jgi:hypothetical protein
MPSRLPMAMALPSGLAASVLGYQEVGMKPRIRSVAASATATALRPPQAM